MQIEKNKLLDILNIFKYILVNNSICEEYKCIYFSGKNIIMSNDKVIISYPFETEFKCYVYLEKILKFLEKIEDKIINLNIKNNFFILKSKKNKLEIKILESTFDIKIREPKKWSKVSSDFILGLKMISLSISEDINFTHDYINILHFKKDQIISTDNKRIGKYKLESSFDTTFCLSHYIGDLLLKIGNIKEYYLKEQFIFFKTENNIILKCILNSSKIPDFENFLSIPKKNIKIEFNKEICKAFDLCNIFNSDLHSNDKKVYLNIKDDKLICYTETNLGKVESKIDLNKEYKKEILFIIHPDFLLDLIKKEKFIFYYSEELGRIYYQDEKYNFVTMTIEEEK
jgi:hypothetical protein